jgi:hypothetical protein
VVFFPKMEFARDIISTDFRNELLDKKAHYDKPDTARIIVNGQRFKVRLFNGMPPELVGSGGTSVGTDPVGLGDTEWNRLMCSICTDDPQDKLLYPKLGPSGAGIYPKADLRQPSGGYSAEGSLVMEHVRTTSSTPQYSLSSTSPWFIRGTSTSANSSSTNMEVRYAANVNTLGNGLRYRPILIHEPWRD